MSGLSIDDLHEGEYCVELTDADGCEGGMFCFYVNSEAGDVTTSSVPCARTITCNGANYIEYFDYVQTLDCNILTSFCPVTGETIIQDLGWADLFISNCSLFGICQTGQTVLLQEGFQEFGPFPVNAPGCPENIGCADFLCNIPGVGYVLDPTTPVTCSSVVYVPSSNCKEGECWAYVQCGSTVVAEGCVPVAFGCGGSLVQSDEENNLVKALGIQSFSYTTAQLFETVNSTEFKNRESKIKYRNEENLNVKFNENEKLEVRISPNPSNGIISLEFNENISGIEIKVYDATGRVVFYEKHANKKFRQKQIDLSSLDSGIYFIRLIDSKNMLSVERIILN